jgi:predicted RNase H-like nuclease (RuvC/YqgF family)
VQELERAAAQAKPAPGGGGDPARLAAIEAKAKQLGEELEELRGENEFLNGEVARLQKKNKELQGQIESMREV